MWLRRSRWLASVALLAFGALPASAHAGTLTPAGFSTAPSVSNESTYLGIAAHGYEPFFPAVNVFQASRDEPLFGGYAASTLEALGPGSCWANPDEPALECGLTPTAGEPFVITGTDGQDHFTELGCNAGYQPRGTPCPRVFKISLGAGDDYIRMWNFSDSFADERDPVTGLRPWVAAAHAPMHGVEMDMGSGRDTVILMGGPSTGRISMGAGDDSVFTLGGYSESQEPVTGGYVISCGPGFDAIQPGPGDKVANDCERILTSSSAEEESERDPALGSDLASTCGTARFDFRKVGGPLGAVRKGKRGCVYLVSNRFARDLLTMAYNSNKNISQSFVKVLSVAAKAPKDVTTGAQTLEDYMRDRLPLPDGHDIIVRTLPRWIRDAANVAGRANPLTLIGQSVGLLAIPLTTLHRIDQIQTKEACLQFTVGVRSGRAHVDSRVIYNPRHFSSRSGSYARVQKRTNGLLQDSYPARYLNLSCMDSGMVATKPRRDTAEIFRTGYRTVGGYAG
jgi:hypothetical protein